jgi:LytS/YehU family sensor histidine kinase
MMLLNLVENAITHGIGNVAKGGIVTIEASVTAGQVRISVRNTGTLSKDFAIGIGTQDAKQRLELLFGDQAHFTLWQMNASTVAADLVFPFSHFFAHSIDPSHSSLS